MKAVFRVYLSGIVNALFNHEVVFKIIGLANRRFKFIKIVYCGYGASKAYLDAYTSGGGVIGKSLVDLDNYKWNPFFAGMFFQNRKIGLIFFISALEDDFYDENGGRHLELLLGKMRRIQTLIGSSELSFAGVIPGLMHRHRMIKGAQLRSKVVDSVIKGINKVIAEVGYPKDTPIIVLGGRGFIGRAVIKQLNNRDVYCIDTVTKNGMDSWPHNLKAENKEAILVNISKKNQLKSYEALAWKKLILLNEVFPEPNNVEIASYSKCGGDIYHLAGVKGIAVPSFPLAYNGAIPCSASWDCDEMEVVLKKLVNPHSVQAGCFQDNRYLLVNDVDQKS